MADRIPVKAIYTGADATALGELATGDTIAASYINGLAGEVTGTGDATVVADNVIDEANLKVSNAPTNGYVLTAQSGNTGGLTWAAASGGSGGGIGEFIGTSIAISSDDTALANDDGTSNINIGMGPNALNATTIGNSNIALGDLSTKLNVTGSHNVALGRLTNYSNTGSGNIAIGNQALMQNTSGQYNVAVGAEALNSTGTASENIGIGRRAGQGVSTGTYNALTGHEAGKSLTTGSYNVAFGYQSLYTNTTASNNTAVGRSALTANTTGYGNTAIGDRALSLTTTGNNNIGIGEYAQSSTAGANGECTLGSTNINNLRCNDQSIASLSDARDKTEIVDSSYGLAFINTVRPRQFKWATRDGNIKDGTIRLGFTAQELLTACNGNNDVLDLVLESNSEKLEAKYSNLIPILTKAIQELSAKNDALEARITTLEG